MESSWHTKITKYFRFVDSSIEKLTNLDNDSDASSTELIKEIVKDLGLIVPKYGVSQLQLQNLLNIILDTTNSKVFNNSIKLKLIKLLVCFQLLDFDTFLQVISSFRLSTYSNDGATINKRLQVQLAKWLLQNFVIFKLNKNFLRILPFLFNLLSIGYVRPYISLVLIYILQQSGEIDPKFRIKYFLNAYKLDYLVELYEKDKSLITLLLVFQDYLKSDNNLPIFDSYYFKLYNMSENVRIPKDLFGTIDYKFIEQLLSLRTQYYEYETGTKPINDLQEFAEFKEFKQNFQSLYQVVKGLNLRHGHDIHSSRHQSKRRKQEDVAYNLSTLELLSNYDFPECFSLSSYVENMDKFKLPLQLGSLLCQLGDTSSFSITNRHLNDQLVDLLEVETVFCAKIPLYSSLLQMGDYELDIWLEHFFSKEGMGKLRPEHKLIYNGLLFLAERSLHVPPFVEKILTRKTVLKYDGAQSEELEILNYWALLPYLSILGWDKFEDVYRKIEPFLLEPAIAGQFLGSIGCLISNWILKTSDTEEPVFWHCINKLLGNVVNTFSQRYCGKHESYFSLKVQFLELLRIIHKLPFSSISISTIILPPVLMYDFFFSLSPILIDGICTHVTFCKRYYGEYLSTFKDSDDHGAINKNLSHSLLTSFKHLHNSYVMDLCNITWRDKSFDRNEKSTAKGFILPVGFIPKLMKQRYYHYDSSADDDEDHDFSSMKKNFNVFYAPAFASTITKIIREMEDKHEVETRLAGPLNESEFNRLINSNDKWLDQYSQDYDYLRIDILESMAKAGFPGLRDLLFSSLKSLSVKRKQREFEILI